MVQPDEPKFLIIAGMTLLGWVTRRPGMLTSQKKTQDRLDAGSPDEVSTSQL